MATNTKKLVPSRKLLSQSDFYSKRQIRGTYDASKSSDENANLWASVDSLSAAAANSPAVRQIIRNRARYEVANNSYASGMVKTLANDVIGPRVQIQLGDNALQQKVESDFTSWAKEIKLFSKLRTARRAKCIDGEAFAMMVTNRRLKNKVKLDIKLIECDMIEGFFVTKENEVDGVKLDENGNPIAYRVLDYHPGDYRIISSMGKTSGKWIDAKYILHYFSCDRPGQIRGISEMVSNISLFGLMRAYTVAVVESARRAAEITGIIQTKLLPDGIAAAEFDEPSITMDFVRNQIMSMPEGWEFSQPKAEQPTNTYKEFKNEIIGESARPFCMPQNVASGNSSDYNYASGRLDHQTYDRGIEIDRAEQEEQMLNRIYDAWIEEYSVKKSLNPGQVSQVSNPQYFYVGRGHVDPKKEADADDSRFKNGSLSLTEYYAKQGKDGKREITKYINERISAEVEWNKARKTAGLAPAPFPLNSIDKANRESEAEEDE